MCKLKRAPVCLLPAPVPQHLPIACSKLGCRNTARCHQDEHSSWSRAKLLDLFPLL